MCPVYADNPLRRARLELGASLSQLGARTFLSPRILQKLDDGQFGDLPGGVYARSYVRSYAAAVGLDPEAMVQQLIDRLPPVEDPLPALREVARGNTPAWVRFLSDLTGNTSTWISPAREPRTTRALQSLRAPLMRWAASFVDASALLLLYVLLRALTAWLCGVDVDAESDLTRAAIAVPWSIIALLYVGLFAGIGGRTPGTWLVGLPARIEASPLDLRTIVIRTLMFTKASASSA
jgi:Helix-turn-helix domain/RDD family